MNSVDRVVRSSVFGLLVGGSRDVTPSEIAVSTGLAVDAVAESFGRLSDEHRLVMSSDGERVVMAHPFSAVPTGYRVEIGERSWLANCAWDAFGILALLGDGKAIARPPGRSRVGVDLAWWPCGSGRRRSLCRTSRAILG